MSASADPLAHGADEVIIGIPRDVALADGAWRGFRRFTSVEGGLAEIARLDRAGSPRPRRELELDSDWKQPIPYAIALYRTAEGERQLFWMDRLAGGVTGACMAAPHSALVDISVLTMAASLSHSSASGVKRLRRQSSLDLRRSAY